MICRSDKYNIINSMKNKYSISFLCSIIGVSRSGHYKRNSRQTSPDRDYGVKQKILEIAAHNYIYWYNNIRIQSKLKYRTPVEYKCAV